MIVGKANKQTTKHKPYKRKIKRPDQQMAASKTTRQVYQADGQHSSQQMLEETKLRSSPGDFNGGGGDDDDDDDNNDEENIVIDLPDEDDDDHHHCDDDTNNNKQSFGSRGSSNSNSNSNCTQQAPTRLEQTGAINGKASLAAFSPGDLIWFDPNQLGYAIPGKVLDFYPELSVLTVEGCGQPVALEDSQLGDETRNRLLVKADESLQVYELSELSIFKTIKRRQPITDTSGLRDLVDLDEISLESIIWNLKLRQKQDLIYTQCGEKILISLNPYKQLFDTYNLDQVNRYDTLTTPAATFGASGQQLPLSASKVNLIKWLQMNQPPDGRQQQPQETSSRLPHIFKMANEALKCLLLDQQHQCFVLLGDSGSGKTEACKLLIQYFASVNKSPTNLMTEQILEAIQVLESFGNSKTILNDNSSRFGKLLEIKFNLVNGFILNAKLIDLNLLDRSRIVCQSEMERNYHVFYELLAGLNKNEKEKYGLQTSDKYFYLNQGHCLELANSAKDDGEDFRSLLASMQVLGFNYEEQDTIFRILASILHLGNIYFHRKVLAVRSGKVVMSTDTGGEQQQAGVEGVEIGSDTEVRWVSHLLQIQFELVMRCLTVRTTDTCSMGSTTTSNTIVTPLNIDQALDTRDAIARALYTCLFKWLVQRINVMINAQEDKAEQDGEQEQDDNAGKEPIYMCRTSESLCEFQPDKLATSARDSNRFRSLLRQQQQTGNKLQAATIGILDAFGFENLAENNFEQLCVNYASELLNYHTHRYLVRLEQAQYTRERLRWQPIESLNSLLATNNTNLLNGHNGNSFTGSSNSNNTNLTATTTTTTTSHGNHQKGSSSSIVNLISKKPLGILALLDDECNFPKATDQSFAEKCHHNHALNENYQCARLAANCQEFGIRHFRHANRMVWYQVDGFIDKNRDSLRPDVLELLLGSKMGIVADMLRKMHRQPAVLDSQGKPSTTGGGGGVGVGKTISRTFDGRYVSMKPRQATVAARFQDTLHNNRVLESLACSTSVATNGSLGSEANYAASAEATRHASNTWFVVCLKPNRTKTANVFDVAFVQEQVKSMGLFDLLQMRKFGFPVRMRYGEFVRRYKCLVPSKMLNNLSSCQDIQAANRRLQLDRQSGDNKSSSKHQQQIIKRAIRDVCSSIVEFKLQQTHTSNHLGELSSLKAQYQCGLTKMFLSERLYHLLESWRLKAHLDSIGLIQKTFRMWLARRDYLLKRRACITIQAEVRAFQARRSFCRQYWLLVNLQRKWRQHLSVRRTKQQEARRRALKEQQQRQMQELEQQHRKQSNQFRFRLHPNNLLAESNNSNYSRALLDIPEDLAQLYRLQRQWQPIHDMSNMDEVNLLDLVLREQARRAKFQLDSSSVPFVVTGSGSGDHNDDDSDTKVADLIDKLELDERFSLQNFLCKYYPPEEAPQFGYSRLPITRPFTWAHLARRRRSQLNKRLRMTNKQHQPDGYEQLVRQRFVDIEQKSVAIYKLILRFIDSDQSLSEVENDQLNLSEQKKHELLLQKVIKFKLISDYINYLCLTEPLLRDEVFLQLASQCWQNPKAKSHENAWKLFLNCLSSFEPLGRNLIKYLIKYCNDNCCDKYRKLICRKLCEALWRSRADKTDHTESQVVSHQRRYPTTIIEYWANQQAIECLALSASCYMDDHSLVGPPTTASLASTNAAQGEDLDDLNTINYSNKTLVQMDSHTTAESLAGRLLKARNIPASNLVGWSVEIQHEGALSEFSSRLRGDDYLLDHFARLELLPELVQLIDDDLETLECDQLDELNLLSDGRHHQQQQQQKPPIDGQQIDCCLASEQSPEVATKRGHPQYQQHQQRQFNRFSSDSRRSWSAANEMVHGQFNHNHHLHQHQQRATTTTPAHQLNHHRHSAAFSEFDLPTTYNSSSGHYQHQYEPHHQAYLAPGQYNHYQAVASNQQHLNRRSMSMQELQLAATSALNGRYFMMGSSNGQPPNGASHSNSPSAHYASSYVSSSQTPDCCRPGPHSGSLRRQSNGHSAELSSGYRRRSATPNSMAPISSSRNGRRLSSSAYGSHNGSSSGNPQVSAGPNLRLARAPERRDPRGPTPRRSASSSSRTPRGGVQNGLSDYASTQSDYERIGYGRHRQPMSASSQPVSPSKRTTGGYLQQRRPMGPAPNKQHQRVNQLRAAPVVLADNQAIQDNQIAHYAATSSAMSDTSEAPSMASHVRKVKVPQSNGDVDRYLDDLFNPLLDEADLDELSDARSLATSIRGCRRVEEDDQEELLRKMSDPLALSKMIRGTTANDDEQQPTRQETLSPTFESLLKSLKAPTSGAEQHLAASGASLDNMNLSELKALNQRLEGEIQAAQSARPSLAELIAGQTTGESSSMIAPPVPPPPPPPSSFKPPSAQLVDDVYSRAKTIRIGKWRWPPALHQAAQTADIPASPSEEEMPLPTGERKRASLMEMVGPEEPSEEQPADKTIEQQDVSKMQGESANNANVGRLKISSMMKAKLEQLTNNSIPAAAATTQVKSTNQQQPPELGPSPASKPPKRLAEQRKNLLENQLLGGVGAKANKDVQPGEPSRPISDTPSVSKVQAAKQQLAAAAGVALAALDSTSGASSQASSRRNSGLHVAPVGASDGFQRSSRQLQLDELGPQSRSAISQRQAFYRISASSDRLDQLAEGPTGATNDGHGGSESELPRATSENAGEPGQCSTQNGQKQSKLTGATPMASDLNEAGQSPPVGHLLASSTSDKQRSLAIERLCGKSIGAKSLSGPQMASKSTVSPSSSSDHHQWVSSCSPVEPTLGPFKPLPATTSESNNAAHHRPATSKETNLPGQVGPKTKTSTRTKASRTEPMRALTHANVDWQVRIRKEVFRPSESYEDPLVVQLIFAQLVADVFNPRHWTRLNNKERAAIKAAMKDNSIGYAASLPQIGEMSAIKRDLVRMARSFGLYFTRSYQALNFACLLDELTFEVGVDSGEEDEHNSDRSSSSSSSSLVSSTGADQTTSKRRSSIRLAVRIAGRLRAAGGLGADWLDMVAVHHSGLRLVALVADQPGQPGQPNPQATPSVGALSSAGPPTPPVGYKVLETLKFRDMTDVTLISERVLLVSMRKQSRHKSWLISSQQANQLATLLRSFLIDYNQQVRPAAASTGHTSEQNQRSPANQQDEHQVSKNALLAAHDGDHGDHLEQRQTSNRLHQLHPAPHPDDVLAHSGRVLPDNLPSVTAQAEPAGRPPRRRPSQPGAANLKTPATPQPPSPSSPPGGGGDDGGGLHGDGHRPSGQPGGGGGARQHDHPDGGCGPHDSGGHGGQSKTTPRTAPATAAEPAGPAGSGLQVNGTSSGAKKNKWQSSLSKMSNKFNIFAYSNSSSKRTQSNNNNNNKTPAEEPTSGQQMAGDTQQVVQLDAWIETQVDFDEDESADEQERNDSHDKDEPKRSEENQQQSDNKQPVDGQQEQQSAQKDDGKHSMLQFALYNFRAAIEKYSLETRLSKSSQTAASQVSSQLEVGDTSTLRGSLKIIESLRGGNAGGPQQQHQQQTDDTNRSNRSKGAEWTWRELADMVKFTQTPIKRSLLRLPNDELDRRAVDCFSAIMQYMGDLPSASSSLQAPGKGAPGGEVECVYLILINCHNYPKLRDEIYCQLIKQTTNNRSAKQDSCLRGWRLFSIVAAYFDCSANLRPYLLKYLEQAAYDKRRAYHSIASVCLQNLRKTFKYKGRKNVPSIEEIAATSAGRNSKRQIYRLPGGTERVINTKSTTVVNDIIHEICSSMLNVQEADEMLEYSLYCIADGDLYTMPLNRDEYILDITTELIKNHQQYFLIFCRSIWHYPLRLDSKLYIEVIFNQIAPDYLEGLLLVLPGEPCDSERGTITSNSGSLRTGRPPTSGRSSATNLSQDYSQQRLQAPSNAPLRLRRHLVKEIARIAALLHRASGTDYIPHKDEIKYLLPKPIVTAIKQQQQRSHHQHESHHQQASSSSSVSSGSQSRLLQQAAVGADEPQQPQQKNRHQDTTVVTPSPQKWVELVQEQCREMSAFEALDAKAQFLDIVRHWPLFGSSFFAIKLIQRDLIQPMEFILALNKLGIQMLDIQTHETIHKYPFNEVVSTRKVRSEDGALFLDMKCGNLMKRTIIRIQTDQAHEISRLIRQYIDIDLLQTSKQVGSANNHLAASQSQ